MIEDQIRCSPTIVEDRVFLAGCDGKLHILDLNDGKDVAQVEIGGPTGVTPAVVGDFVYFGTEGGEFLCINWKEAVVAWTFAGKNSTSYRSSAAATPEQVIVGSRAKRVHALNPKNGEELWTFATKQRIDSSPVIVGERVYVGSTDGRIYGLNRTSGKMEWEYEAKGGFTGSPAVVDGKLVIASDDGVVYCFGKKEE
jgi:outer membrane protein assembly factor BamB